MRRTGNEEIRVIQYGLFDLMEWLTGVAIFFALIGIGRSTGINEKIITLAAVQMQSISSWFWVVVGTYICLALNGFAIAMLIKRKGKPFVPVLLFHLFSILSICLVRFGPYSISKALALTPSAMCLLLAYAVLQRKLLVAEINRHEQIAIICGGVSSLVWLASIVSVRVFADG